MSQLNWHKLFFCLITHLSFSPTLVAQSVSKQVIGPSGTTFENGTNKLSYTTGEVVVGAMTAEACNSAFQCVLLGINCI